jgi:hypothetical protein
MLSQQNIGMDIFENKTTKGIMQEKTKSGKKYCFVGVVAVL